MIIISGLHRVCIYIEKKINFYRTSNLFLERMAIPKVITKILINGYVNSISKEETLPGSSMHEFFRSGYLYDAVSILTQ